MKDRTTRFFRRYWLAFAIVILFMAMWVVLWNIRYSRVGITTVIIVPDLFGSPVSAIRMVGEDPVREEVWLDVPKGRGLLVADVYRPQDGDVHGGMVIAVGAAPKILHPPRPGPAHQPGGGVLPLAWHLLRPGGPHKPHHHRVHPI